MLSKGEVILMALALIVILVFALVTALVARRGGAARGGAARGGAARATPRWPDQHVVVDGLNLAHWWRGRAGASADGATDRSRGRRPLAWEDIAAAVRDTAPILKKRFRGRVMYVLKDRESVRNSPGVRADYAALAEEAGVHIYLAEKYAEGEAPADAVSPAARASHAALGRDDFLLVFLAHRWRCPILTADALRDLAEFRTSVEPFLFYEFRPSGGTPHRDYLRPDAGLRPGLMRRKNERPWRIRPHEVF